MLGNRVPFVHPWNEMFLREVTTVEVGGTPSTAIPTFWGGDIPWMTSGDIHLRRVVDVPGRITEVGLVSSNAKLIEPPSVAVALAGQGKTRGTVALVLAAVSTNQSVAMLQPKQGVLLPSYLYHALDARYEELRARSSGGGRGGLSKAILESLPIPLPPLSEQLRIADILDTADAAIQQTEALISKLKLMRAGLLHDLLTRGLDENGELRDPVAHPEQFQDSIVGKMPVGWDVNSLGQTLISIDAGKSPDFPDTPARSGEWGVLKVSAVRPAGFQPLENKMVTSDLFINPEYEVHDGDLLISRANTYELVGIVCLVVAPPPRLMLSDKTLRLNVDHRKAVSSYIFHSLQTPSIRRQIEMHATGSSGSMKNISQNALRSLVIPLPSVEEQDRIARIINTHDARIRAEEAYCDKLKHLKQGLMDDLLTGRIRVPVEEGVTA